MLSGAPNYIPQLGSVMCYLIFFFIPKQILLQTHWNLFLFLLGIHKKIIRQGAACDTDWVSPYSWRYHPSVHRDGTASTWNLFLMPLPLLLLEMAGTCYIITEGGKTHTFQQYLSTDRKHSNHFKLGDLSGLPEASQSSQTGSWSGSQAASKPDRQSHLSAPSSSLISHCDHQRPGFIQDLCHCQRKKRAEKHPCKSPQVCFMWGLAEFIPIKIVHKHFESLLERRTVE